MARGQQVKEVGDEEMPSELFNKGLAVRKKVLGEAYVQKSLAGADSFMMMFQELVTEACWGKVWAREGLTLKQRSMLNIAIIATLGRSNELKLHLKGALNNGCGPEEIGEILLQVATYAGMPAGLDGFKVARETFAEAGITIAPAEPRG